MAVFHLQIVTPDRRMYDGDAEKIILRTVAGDVCIMAHHINYVSPIGVGECRVTDAEGNNRIAACNGGMLVVSNNTVRVIATTFEWAEDIDIDRAKKAKETAEKQMEEWKDNDQRFSIAEAKLKRAVTRIHVAE